MQLKHRSSIRTALITATAALVGASPAAAAGLSHSETSFVIYSERDRVKASEGLFRLDKQLRGNYRFNMRLMYDGLSGASPTGGSVSKYPQTLTRPSGGGTVLVAAGELPVDESFGDTRFAAEVGLSRQLSSATSASLSAYLSSEHDYRSLGLNAGITKDFSSGKNSLGLAVSVMRDVNSPLGGVPTPLTSTATPVEAVNGRRVTNGNGHERNYSAVVSFTRVLTPTSIARVSYSIDYASGYLTDPYKIVSIVQSADSADPGEPVDALYERRPDSRLGSSLLGNARKYMLGMMVEAEYRYFWDDWDIRSHTVYFSIKYDFGRSGAFQPHLRYYTQGRANFSKPFLLQGAPLPNYASADSRLAKFSALTYGLSYTVPTSPSSRLTLAAEWYSQRGDKSPPESFGPLLKYNLFPNLNAVVLRMGLAHDF